MELNISNLSSQTSNDENKMRELQQIQNQIKSMKKPPHICFLVPCYGGTIFLNFHTSLINTLQLMSALGIKSKVLYCPNDSLVTRARNNLVAKGMADLSVTHLMFIDTDITWEPVEILKLLFADKYLCGGIYPLKKYNWEFLENPNFANDIIEKRKNNKFQTNDTTQNYLQSLMVKYNVNLLMNKQLHPNGMLEVKHLPTGFMMFKRETIEKMMEAFPQSKYRDDVGFLSENEHAFAYNLFDTCIIGTHLYSEDWTFCHKWKEMGGNCYAHIGVNLTHTGQEHFKGSFINFISSLTYKPVENQPSTV